MSEAGAERLTEQQVAAQIHRIFSDVRDLVERWDRNELTAAVQPNSSLVADDAKSAPYQVSHGVEQLLGVAIDHLHALGGLLLEARLLHVSAPFTLTRSAIEAAATGLWMLSPGGRPERVVRRLRHAAQDARDMDTVVGELQVPAPRPLTDRLSEMQAIGDAIAGRHVSLRAFKITDIMTEVDHLPASHMEVKAAWRICSGFAHGRLWPSLSMLDREVQPGRLRDDAAVRITNSMDRVLWASWVGHDPVRETLRLHSQRSSSPWHPFEYPALCDRRARTRWLAGTAITARSHPRHSRAQVGWHSPMRDRAIATSTDRSADLGGRDRRPTRRWVAARTRHGSYSRRQWLYERDRKSFPRSG